MEICREKCRLLPANFELNMKLLLNNMCKDPATISIVGTMVTELEKVVGQALA